MRRALNSKINLLGGFPSLFHKLYWDEPKAVTQVFVDVCASLVEKPSNLLR